MRATDPNKIENNTQNRTFITLTWAWIMNKDISYYALTTLYPLT